VRVLSIVHHRNAAAGVFADPALANGHELVEWLPHEGPPPKVEGFGAAFVFGAEAQVDQEDAYPWLRPEKQVVRELLDRGTPVLGVCFGSQLVAEAAGAPVRRAEQPEIGWHEVELTPDGRRDELLGGLPERFESFQYHHYEWLLPPRAVTLAHSARCLQAFRLADRPVWGLQFHPEVTQPDLGSWLDDWQSDAAAVATGLDPESIRTESEGKIGAWNDIGRGLAERFLALSRAASRTPT
jgi:GMP synthase-like glutamine amidotransferase